MSGRDAFIDQAHLLHAALLREFLAPPISRDCSGWADEIRRIVKGPEKGIWRTSRTPYLREPMDCTDPENPVQKVVMQFATQLGKSEVIYNAVFKRIHLQPMDMMLVQPTLQDAKDHSRQRFVPTAKAMPEIMRRLPRSGSRDETNTWQTKEIQGGATLFFSGANSARSLASKPLPFAGCDEIDGYPLDVDGEGDPLSLVWERMSNFPQRKMLLCSTPTTKDVSRIEAEYLASDRRRYWVPCPHCGEFQMLEWGRASEHGIKWLKTPTGEPRSGTAVYVCRHHGCVIEDRQKSMMLPEGVWRPDKPGAQDGLVAGFHLSKLYSPVGWKSWAMLVADWHKANEAAKTGDTSRLKTFVNTSLAETWEDAGDKADEHALLRRAADYPLRTVPNGGLVLTAGVDVQGDRLEAYAWAWGRGEESWLVEHQVIYGDPAIPETEIGSPWAALTEWRRLPLTHASGARMTITACAVDSGGHHTDLVYRYARRHAAEHVIAVKGASTAGRAIIGKPTQVEFNHHGRKINGGAQVWLVGTDTAKSLLYGRLQVADAGPGYVHLTKQLPPYVFEQITSERRKTTYVKGHPRLEWVKPPGKRNEALDCAVYAMAAAWHIGVSRHTEHHWAKYQARLMQPDLLAHALTLDTPAATIPTVAHVTQAPPTGEPADASTPPGHQASGPATAPPDHTAAPTTAAPAPPNQQSTPRPQQQRPTGRHAGRSGWVKRW